MTRLLIDMACILTVVPPTVVCRLKIIFALLDYLKTNGHITIIFTSVTHNKSHKGKTYYSLLLWVYGMFFKNVN